jgi:hypothetical protein
MKNTMQLFLVALTILVTTTVKAQDPWNPFDNCDCTQKMERDIIFGGSNIVYDKGVTYIFYAYFKPDKNSCFQNYTNKATSMTVEAFENALDQNPTYKMLKKAGKVDREGLIGDIYWSSTTVEEIVKNLKEATMKYASSEQVLKAIELDADYEISFSQFKTCTK